MSAQMNMTLAKAVWDALSVGDVEVLDELMAENLQWHVPGKHRLSGTKTNRNQVMDYLGTLGEETDVYDLELRGHPGERRPRPDPVPRHRQTGRQESGYVPDAVVPG